MTTSEANDLTCRVARVLGWGDAHPGLPTAIPPGVARSLAESVGPVVLHRAQVPCYAMDWSYMRDVVEWIGSKGGIVNIQRLFRPDLAEVTIVVNGLYRCAKGEGADAPEAVCRAALDLAALLGGQESPK